MSLLLLQEYHSRGLLSSACVGAGTWPERRAAADGLAGLRHSVLGFCRHGPEPPLLSQHRARRGPSGMWLFGTGVSSTLLFSFSLCDLRTLCWVLSKMLFYNILLHHTLRQCASARISSDDHYVSLPVKCCVLCHIDHYIHISLIVCFFVCLRTDSTAWLHAERGLVCGHHRLLPGQNIWPRWPWDVCHFFSLFPSPCFCVLVLAFVCLCVHIMSPCFCVLVHVPLLLCGCACPLLLCGCACIYLFVFSYFMVTFW